MLSVIFLPFFCSLINSFDWLQNHLIPCPFKYLTGIDCPGCGFQRSFIELIQGNFEKSWSIYPPTTPLIFLFITAAILYKFKIKSKAIVFKILVILVGNFVVLVYLHKTVIR
ncbi:DUF2752 domain-containing protein [Pedobacter jamesrossensis]|uniref:DUF2752 domain-containing protein n=1 Tax=Pedobacter jamesrossensis TaxID=1908238 RepID=A0ABV8NSK5_9SPHI